MRYSPELQTELYRTMLRIREIEELLAKGVIKGEIKTPCHLYVGQEAIATGLCAALASEDYIFGSHRSHGHYLAKGGDLQALVAEIYGKATGCARGRGGSMHVIAPPVGLLGTVPIVGGTVSLAVGAALAIKIRHEKRLVVSFFGDGALGEGVVHEAFNFAALKRLPIIFACENNLYSTHLPIRECRLKNNIWESGQPFGILGQRVDGNNVQQVFQAGVNAVKRCKTGRGPVLLEFMTYRLRGHVGPDDNLQGDHTDIRPASEIARWRKKDPLLQLERSLIKNRLATKTALAAIKKDVQKEVRSAYQFARKSPYPDPKDLARYVYKK